MAHYEPVQVCVVGMGYVGLPSAAVMAGRGMTVLGVDIAADIVDTINAGAIHIAEPGLEDLVAATVARGTLRAAMTPQPADAFVIAVPTPCKEPDHRPDMRAVEAAARAIAPHLRAGNLVILESTSPVGSTETLARWLADARPDLVVPQRCGDDGEIHVAHCPERVLPGNALEEIVSNDRVIGGITPACASAAYRLYSRFTRGACTLASSARVAEMAKLTENSFRDVNIAFANELSIIGDRLGIDVWELIALVNRHPRVSVLNPGPGVGGHCIAVDPWFIVAAAPEDARIVRTAREVNDAKPRHVLAQIDAAIAGAGKPDDAVAVALYGLTFKEDVDDLRESPALAIARAVVSAHPGPVSIVEPHVAALPEGLERARLTDPASAATADVHVMLVAHATFRALPRPGGGIVDTRGVWQRGDPVTPHVAVPLSPERTIGRAAAR